MTGTATGHSLQTLLKDRPIIRVSNKIDLLSNIENVPDGISTSALTGQGLDTLRTAILEHLRAGSTGAEEGALNNLRHREAITAALTALKAAALASEIQLPHELILVDLHMALTALDTLTGTTTAEHILALIFSTFCIGK